MTGTLDRAFARFADWTADFVATAYFFAFCVLTVLVWVPSIVVMPEEVPGVVDTWQLIINTFTTIVTFLMMALLHNTQHRFERAQNARWVALLRELGIEDPVSDDGQVVEASDA